MTKLEEIAAPLEIRNVQHVTVLESPELIWRDIGECRESTPEEYTEALIAASNLAAISRLFGIVFIGPNAVNTPTYGIEPSEEFYDPAWRRAIRREAFLQSFQTAKIRYDMHLSSRQDRQWFILDRFVRHIYKIGNVPFKYSSQSFSDQLDFRSKDRDGGPYARGNELAARSILSDMVSHADVLLHMHYGFPHEGTVTVQDGNRLVEYNKLRLQVLSYISTLLAGHQLDRILKTLRSSKSVDQTLADHELRQFFGAGVFTDQSVENTIRSIYNHLHPETSTE